MGASFQKNDVGTSYKLFLRNTDSTARDISSAVDTADRQIRFQDPTGTNTDKDADFFTDGTDGILVYTFISGDLDLAGRWKAQATVALSTGTQKSSVEDFIVHDNL